MQKFQILFQDQNIAVICKDSGLLSVPYPGFRGKTALGLLEESMRKRGTYSASHRPFAVHRLDKDTSGVMMFALNERAQKTIMDSWQVMVSERLYRAVAENPSGQRQRGGPDALPDEGLIDSPLAYNAYNQAYVPKARASGPGGQSRQAGSPRSVGPTRAGGGSRPADRPGQAGQPRAVDARTHYKIIARGKQYTLFELSLDTGRKNQIRAHLASLGRPLCGDKNYRARTSPFGRLALHARVLEFIHPWTKEKMRFEVPEPEAWEKRCMQRP